MAVNLNYDEVCKMIGNLYIASQKNLGEAEEQFKAVLAKNDALSKALNEALSKNSVKEPAENGASATGKTG